MSAIRDICYKAEAEIHQLLVDEQYAEAKELSIRWIRMSENMAERLLFVDLRNTADMEIFLREEDGH